MDTVEQVSSSIEVQEHDLLGVKSEVEEYKYLQHDEERDFSGNLSHMKSKLTLTCIMLNCLLQCRQIVVLNSDPDSQLILRLVECPFCLWECKNCPDRLLQLLDHAQQIHRASLNTIAAFILEKYPQLISFMLNEYSKQLQAP